MALKGKGKSRSRSGKRVTPGPKFQPIPAPVPFYRRRGFQVAVAFLAGVAVVMLITWVRDELRASEQEDRANEQAAALRSATQEFKNLVEPIVTEAGTPTGITIDVFPRLPQDLDAFADGKASTQDVRASAAATREVATDGADKLRQVDVVAIYGDQGIGQADILDAISARERMLHAFEVYVEAANVAERAADSTGSDQEDIAGVARRLAGTAEAEFKAGFDDFVRVQESAGVFVPPEAAGGIPTELPEGLPADAGALP